MTAPDGNNFQISHPVAGLYKASPSTLGDGDQDVLRMTSAGLLRVAVESGGTVGTAAGDIANDAADSTSYPVKIGGKATTLPPAAVTEADRVNASFNLQGSLRVEQTVSPQAWSLTHTSNAAAQGTATQAASSTGGKHVMTGFTAQLVGDATGNADFVIINIRDGATGAGTVKMSHMAALASGANATGTPVVVTGLNIVGTANVAMTIEGSTVGATHTITRVNAWGYTTK